jgi:hypothetical protein
MISRPKRLPRLWCALQGLLPLNACLAAQQGELAWPRELPSAPVGQLPVPPSAATDVRRRVRED